MNGIASRLSARARDSRDSPIRALFSLAQRPGMISLAGGWPATALLDEPGLRESFDGVQPSQRQAFLQYGASAGESLYEDACRTWLAQASGLKLDQHRFLATSGAQQAIELVARTIVDPGDRVAVEAPTYPAAIACFRAAGATLVEIPSDVHGMRVDALARVAASTPLKAVYVVPTHGNPTGRCMPAERRRALARLTADRGIHVIEDDPYAALGFDGIWPRSVAAHAEEADPQAKWAIHIASFSKVLGPGLRAGFALMPPDIAAAAERLKQLSDIHSARWPQIAIGRYLGEGRMPAQLERVRARYALHCEALCEALDRFMVPMGFRYGQPTGGMFVWGSLPRVDARLLLERAVARGAIFVPGAPFFAGAANTSTLRLSFAGAEPGQLREGVRRMAEAAAALLIE